MFDDVIRAQTKETCVWIENGDIMLRFVKSAGICGYGVPTLQDYNRNKNKVTLRNKG